MYYAISKQFYLKFNINKQTRWALALYTILFWTQGGRADEDGRINQNQLA